MNTTWALGRLIESETRNIKLALTMTKGSRNWVRLTTPLILFHAGLLSVKPDDSIDYPLCFNINNTPI